LLSAVSAGVFVTTAVAATLLPLPLSLLPLPVPPLHEHLQFLWCAKEMCQPYFHRVLASKTPILN
jgi:hypothetical protein